MWPSPTATVRWSRTAPPPGGSSSRSPRGFDVAIIAMVSAKGSPGVSTTALACTLSWNSRVVLAECDPAGGTVLTGYLSRMEIPPIGLLPLAAAALRDQLAVSFDQQLVDLDKQHPWHRLVLPG